MMPLTPNRRWIRLAIFFPPTVTHQRVFHLKEATILKRKNEEWHRAQREWSLTWRQVDARNFYKLLDYTGINCKQNNKKAITTKAFVTEIDNVRTEQDEQERQQLQQRQKRTRSKGVAVPSRGVRPACARGSLGFQLSYLFADSWSALRRAQARLLVFRSQRHPLHQSSRFPSLLAPTHTLSQSRSHSLLPPHIKWTTRHCWSPHKREVPGRLDAGRPRVPVLSLFTLSAH